MGFDSLNRAKLAIERVSERHMTAIITLLGAGLAVAMFFHPDLMVAPPEGVSLGILSALFGGSKSKSTQKQSSESTGFGFDQGMNMSQAEQAAQATSFGTTGSTARQNIYGGQEPYLQALYANAAGLLGQNMPERQVADLNPALATGLAQQFGFSQGAGQDIFGAQLMSALQNMGGFGTAGAAANRMAGGDVFGAPMTNGLNFNTLAASVNNPFLSGQIDAASRDVVRNLNENQLTGNASAAAGTMNSGSSRRAVMDAIAQRGAADRVADIASNFRGNAFAQGLGLANQTALANQNAAMNTNALNAGLMQSGSQLALALGQQGQQGLQQAYGTGLANTQAAQDSGNVLRQYQQQLLDTAFQNQMNPYSALQLYQSFIGAPTVLSSSDSFGQQGSQSTSGSQSSSFGANFGLNTQRSNSTLESTSTQRGSNGLLGGLGSLASGVGALGMGGIICWVAREVYGEDNPKWRLFRAWVVARSPMWFYNLYRKHGEKFAAWISDKPLLKAAIRKWMDGRIKTMVRG